MLNSTITKIDFFEVETFQAFRRNIPEIALAYCVVYT